jgi:Prokaryotic N-terminal methylation motif
MHRRRAFTLIELLVVLAQPVTFIRRHPPHMVPGPHHLSGACRSAMRGPEFARRLSVATPWRSSCRCERGRLARPALQGTAPGTWAVRLRHEEPIRPVATSRASRRASRRIACALTLCAIVLSSAAIGCDSKPQAVSGDGGGKAKREMLRRYQDSFQYKGKRPAPSASHK